MDNSNLPNPPEGYRILVAKRFDCDSGDVDRWILAVKATISFQLRWDEYCKDGDPWDSPSGLLLAGYEPGIDPVQFRWNDDIREPIRLPPNSYVWNESEWRPRERI